MRRRRITESVILGVAILFMLFAVGRRYWLNHGPRAECAESVFQFAQIGPGDVVQHTFVVHNVGDSPLEIIDAKSGCPCTVVGPIKTHTLQPGSCAEVPAVFTPTGKSGPQRQVILVLTNDRQNPKVWLHLNGTFLAPSTRPVGMTTIAKPSSIK